VNFGQQHMSQFMVKKITQGIFDKVTEKEINITKNKKFVFGLGIGLILLVVVPGIILLSGRDKSEEEI